METIGELLDRLPEKYQPIFSRPDLSSSVSRESQDRLQVIIDVHAALASVLKRPVRVLDLGCAQGFFTLNLAQAGAIAHGVDYLKENIDLCSALADAHPELAVTFQHAELQDVIRDLQADQYDLVLGFSVFHHLIHGAGLSPIKDLVDRLGELCASGLYELAQHSEPVYWAESLPAVDTELLGNYSFVRRLATLPTHLSSVSRPIYFTSNRFWLVNREIAPFYSVKSESHPYTQGVHGNTREYYFGTGTILKRFAKTRPDGLDVNVAEMARERDVLSMSFDEIVLPKLIAYEEDEADIYLCRELIEGTLLSDLLEAGTSPPSRRILDDVLAQLVAFEAKGLYHNDVRPWNILVDSSGKAFLIDFGALVTEPRDCAWPNDVFLSFITLAREIFNGEVARPSPIRPALLTILALPQPYQSAFRALLGLPRNEWRFSTLRTYLYSNDEQPHPLTSEIGLNETLLAHLEKLSEIANHEVLKRAEMADHAEQLREDHFQRASTAESQAHAAEVARQQAVDHAAAAQAEKRRALDDAARINAEMTQRLHQAEHEKQALLEHRDHIAAEAQELRRLLEARDESLHQWHKHPFKSIINYYASRARKRWNG